MIDVVASSRLGGIAVDNRPALAPANRFTPSRTASGPAGLQPGDARVRTVRPEVEVAGREATSLKRDPLVQRATDPRMSGHGGLRSPVPRHASSSCIDSASIDPRVELARPFRAVEIALSRDRFQVRRAGPNDGGKRVTPTDRLSGFGTGLATNSDSGERVPRGHYAQYSTRNGSARASFFRSLATQKSRDGRLREPGACSTSLAGGCSRAFRSRLPPPSARVLTYSAHRPIEAYGGDSGPLPSPLHL